MKTNDDCRRFLAMVTAFAVTGLVAWGAVDTTVAAPAFVGTDSLAWYDAADAATITADDAGVVSSWADKSPNARTASVRTGATGPSVSTVDGVPCLDFGGVNSGKDMVYTRMTTIRTAFFVGKYARNIGAFLLGDGGSNGQYNFHRGEQGEYFSGHAKISRVWNGTRLVTDPLWEILPDGGVQFISCEMSQNCCSDSLTADRWGTGVQGRNGGRQLCEVILFARTLTDEERTAVFAYLQAKWRLDVPTSATPTWTGHGSTVNLNDGSNWQAGTAPAANAAALAFIPGGHDPFNNFAYTMFGTLSFLPYGFGSLAFTGSPLMLSGAVDNRSGGLVTFAGGLIFPGGNALFIGSSPIAVMGLSTPGSVGVPAVGYGNAVSRSDLTLDGELDVAGNVYATQHSMVRIGPQARGRIVGALEVELAGVDIQGGAKINVGSLYAGGWGVDSFRCDGEVTCGTDFYWDAATVLAGTGTVTCTTLNCGNNKVNYYEISRINVGTGGLGTYHDGNFIFRFRTMTVGMVDGDATWSRRVELQGGHTTTFDLTGTDGEPYDLTLAGWTTGLSGAGSFVKTGAGTLTLPAENPVSGGATFREGRTVLSGTMPSAPVSVEGGTLTVAGAKAFKSLDLARGTLDLQDGVANAVTLAAESVLRGGTIKVDYINGQIDTLVASAGLSMALEENAKIAIELHSNRKGIVLGSYPILLGADLTAEDAAKFTLTTDDADNAMELAVENGALVVKVVKVAALEWCGEGGNGKWSTPGNWFSGIPPVNGDGVTFSGTLNTTPENDVATLIPSLAIKSGAGAFTFTGIDAALLLVNNAADATNVQAIDFNVVNGEETLAVVNSGVVAFNGNVAAADAVVSGGGTLALNGPFALSGDLSLRSETSLALNGTGTVSGMLDLGTTPLIEGTGNTTFGGLAPLQVDTVFNGNLTFGSAPRLPMTGNKSLTIASGTTKFLANYTGGGDQDGVHFSVAEGARLEFPAMNNGWTYSFAVDGELAVEGEFLFWSPTQHYDGTGVTTTPYFRLRGAAMVSSGSPRIRTDHFHIDNNGGQNYSSVKVTGRLTLQPLTTDLTINSANANGVTTASADSVFVLNTDDVEGVSHTIVMGVNLGGSGRTELKGHGTVALGAGGLSLGALMVGDQVTLALPAGGRVVYPCSALTLAEGTRLVFPFDGAESPVINAGETTVAGPATIEITSGALAPGAYPLIYGFTDTLENVRLAWANGDSTGELAKVGTTLMLRVTAGTGAAGQVWTGAMDNRWSVAANWRNETAPGAGSALVFADARGGEVVNDLEPGFAIDSISFPASVGVYRMKGEAIALSGTVANASGKVQELRIPIVKDGNFSLELSQNNGLVLSNVTCTGALNYNTSATKGALRLEGDNAFESLPSRPSNDTSFRDIAFAHGTTCFAQSFLPDAMTVRIEGDAAVVVGGQFGGGWKTVYSTFNGVVTADIFYYDVEGSISGSGTINCRQLNIGNAKNENFTLNRINIGAGGFATYQNNHKSTFYPHTTTLGVTECDSTWAEKIALTSGQWTKVDAVDTNGVPRTVTISGVVSGNGGLDVTGGRVVLTAANTHTGTTTVEAGSELRIAGRANSSMLFVYGTTEFAAGVELAAAETTVYAGGRLAAEGALTLKSLAVQAGGTFETPADAEQSLAVSALSWGAGMTWRLGAGGQLTVPQTFSDISGVTLELMPDAQGGFSAYRLWRPVLLASAINAEKLPVLRTGVGAASPVRWQMKVVDNGDGTQSLCLRRTLPYLYLFLR